MPFVAILGAGPLGGALAWTLAARGRFDEVRLIDPQQTLAAGKALDILQAGPVDNVTTRVSGGASLEAAAGAWVAVLADPSPAAPPDSSAMLALLRELRRLTPGAIVVCAGGSHRPLVSRAIATGISSPDTIVGSAPAAAASAARALVALHVDLSPSVVDVAVTSLERDETGPRAPCAIDWEHSTIAGVPATGVLPREQRQRLDHQLAAAWPPGALTLAAAASLVAEAAWFGSRRPWACWWSVDGGASAARVERLRFCPGGRVKAVAPRR